MVVLAAGCVCYPIIVVSGTAFADPAPAPPAALHLALSLERGIPGTSFTATATGARECLLIRAAPPNILFDWPFGQKNISIASDAASAAFTVPASATPGAYAVTATCNGATAKASFTVTPTATGATEPAVLALAPARGAPRDSVQVAGDRFACNDAGAIELFFDSQLLASPSPDVSGHFDTIIKVPADARAGNYTVRAACDAGSAVATAGFTVVPAATVAPTTTGTQANPSPPLSRWNLGWLLLVIFGVVAAVAYRHWRKPPAHHVSAAVSLASLTPLVSTLETPTDGERTHALRLQTHADPGIQTVSEVDSDRI